MTEDQTQFLDEAEESLRISKVILDGNSPEFATARAYYAMFYAATAMLMENGLRFSKHSGVISAFGSQFIKTGILPNHLHGWLIEAHRSRLVADYTSMEKVSAEEAKTHLQRAREFIDAVRARLG